MQQNLHLVKLRDLRYQAQTVEVMRRVLHADSVCLDIGAHVGTFLREILNFAQFGLHHAFEPLPTYAESLQRDFPTVTVHGVALGNVNGETDFIHVTSHPGYSGISHRPNDLPDVAMQDIRVPIRRLDDVLGSNVKVDFVKVDVEGGELGVFLGGANTFVRGRPYVAFEHTGVYCCREFGTTSAELYNTITAMGLKLSMLDAWLNGGVPLSLEAFLHQQQVGQHWCFLAHP